MWGLLEDEVELIVTEVDKKETLEEDVMNVLKKGRACSLSTE